MLRWVIAIAAALVVAAAAIAVLGITVLGPSSLVRAYLDALARGDATGALELPGVDDAGSSRLLLQDDALSGLRDLREVSTVPGPDGTWLVTYDWRAPSGEGRTTFSVRQVGWRLGVFPEWGFATTPLATLQLAVQHDPRFTVNDLETETGLDTGDPRPYAVLAPGSYVFSHESEFLRAEPVVVEMDGAGSYSATLDIQAAPAFAEQAGAEIRAFLEACAEQRVLFPTGCPFGQQIRDRVVSDPVWTIVQQPAVEVRPSATFGTWSIPATAATAHLVVDVRSIYDGSVSTFDEDVPFVARFDATIRGDRLRIVPADG